MIVISDENDLMMMDDKEYHEHMLSFDADEVEEHATSALLEEKDLFPTTNNDELSKAFEVAHNIIQEDIPCAEVLKREDEPKVNKSQNESSAKNQNESSVKNQNGSSSAIEVPNKYDILCGQSRTIANHFGNQNFQTMLDMYAPRYSSTSCKQQKMALTKEIVARIQELGGRFLKFQKDTGDWLEITDVTARDKISHALRTKVTSWKRKKEQAEQQQERLDAAELSGLNKAPRRRSRRKSAPTNIGLRRRRSSVSSVATAAPPTSNLSFDAANNGNKDNEPISSSSSSVVMDELLRNQKAILAALLTNESSSGGGGNGGGGGRRKSSTI